MGDTFPPLSPRVVLALARIIGAAHSGHPVLREIDGYVVEGTARHLVVGPDDYAFPPEGADVRGTCLRVTGTTGVEMTWLVSDLVSDMQAGTFGVQEP